MKLQYKQQLILSVAVIILFNILTTVLKSWVYRSVGWCICGIIWILHPVLINGVEPTEQQKNIVRIGGVIMILIGVFTRGYYY